MSDNKPFWKFKTENRPHEVAFYWAEAHIAQMALETGQTDYEYSAQGVVRQSLSVDDLLKDIVDMGFRLFYRQVAGSGNSDDYYFYVKDNAAVWVDITRKNGGIIFNTHTLDEENLKKFKELAAKYITKIAKKGSAYALLSSQNGPQLRSIGVAGEDFIDSNYKPEVAKEYRHIVEDLNSDDPCGRIVILDGPPGTGKTHMVRALLNEVPKATFVLIQSSMISALGAPDFLTALMREQRTGHPLVLILEDADEALSSRKADNISAISALLNFSDGIFGAIMDMRIIATTNIDLADLDKAVMRDGRLCRRIEVGLLDADHAEQVYQRIAGKPSEGKFTSGNFYPLGTVYALAKGSGAARGFEVKKAKAPIGFATSVPEVYEGKPLPIDDEDVPKLEPWNGEPLQPGQMIPGTKPGDFITRFDREGNQLDNGFVVGKDGALEEPDDDDDLIDEDPPDDDEDDEPYDLKENYEGDEDED